MRSDKSASSVSIDPEINNSASTSTNMENTDILPADDGGDIVPSSNLPMFTNQGKKGLFQPPDFKFPQTLISGVQRSLKAQSALITLAA